MFFYLGKILYRILILFIHHNIKNICALSYLIFFMI